MNAITQISVCFLGAIHWFQGISFLSWPLMPEFDMSLIGANFLKTSFIIFLLFVTYLLLYRFSKTKINIKTNYSEFEPKERQYRLYLLFMGIIIPVMEIIYEINHVRHISLLKVNCCVGAFLIFVYFLTLKSKWFD